MKLEIEGVSRTYDGQAALDGVSLRVENRQSVVLIGPSGGGKSTLLRLLGGLDQPASGHITVNGAPLGRSEEKLRLYRRGVGTVFQAFNLFPHLTALGNLTLPLEKVHGLAPAEAVSAAQEHLARFGLAAHAHKKPAELSGGQRQRVAIARALSIKPQLMLFDEPTSALDPEMTAEVLEAIEQLRAEGRDLVIATHHLAFARRIADEVVVLAGGKVVDVGSPRAVFDQSSCPLTRRFVEKVLRF